MPRFTIDFNDADDEELTAMAKRKDITKAEVMRRAITLYCHIQNRLGHDRRLSITDMAGKHVTEVLFI